MKELPEFEAETDFLTMNSGRVHIGDPEVSFILSWLLGVDLEVGLADN